MNVATVPAPRIVNFQRERYSEKLVQEMLPLWKKHYQEISLYKDIPLSPLLQVYEMSDKSGMLRIFTVRENENLVGYQVFFVHHHPHYSTTLEAVQDILFLSSELRRGMNGYRFIKWCDEELRHDKVQVVFQHVKKTHNFGPLLQRLGYVEHDIIYSRRLK